MANTVGYFSKYLNMLDRVNKKASVTSMLEANPDSVRFSSEDAKTVYLKEITVPGLGDYDRDTGYSSGDVTITWRAYQMGQDRSKKLKIDTIDMKEAMTEGAELGAEFQRRSVAPELDAYFFHKVCSLCSIDASADLTYDTVIAAIRTGIQTLDEAEVPQEDRIIWVSPEVTQLMEDSGEFFKTVQVQQNNGVVNTKITSFNDHEVVQVPKARFYQAFDFSSSDGFSASSGAELLNFVICNKKDIIKVKKYDEFKIIPNAYNADYSGTLLCFRIYHEVFIKQNKLNNVYIHKRAT